MAHIHKQYEGKNMGIISVYLDVDNYKELKQYLNSKGSSFSKLVNLFIDDYIRENRTDINISKNK